MAKAFDAGSWCDRASSPHFLLQGYGSGGLAPAERRSEILVDLRQHTDDTNTHIEANYLWTAHAPLPREQHSRYSQDILRRGKNGSYRITRVWQPSVSRNKTFAAYDVRSEIWFGGLGWSKPQLKLVVVVKMCCWVDRDGLTRVSRVQRADMSCF